ncbi:MAG: fructose 1,6-bisphosphatase [Methanothrix sp.]|nr:fructose 1,6-bisphosphatase [Methanothrix sp.]
MPNRITISLIKADVGDYSGHSSVHPALIEIAESKIEEAKKSDALIDFKVLACGNNDDVHAQAWETFEVATEVATKLKLYGAGQDLLADVFSGNIRGIGLSIAEVEINEPTAKPIGSPNNGEAFSWTFTDTNGKMSMRMHQISELKDGKKIYDIREGSQPKRVSLRFESWIVEVIESVI